MKGGTTMLSSNLKKSSNLKSQKGFTLIELMIVVAIIGILSAIAIPNFLAFRMKAKASEAKSNLGSIRTCEEAYKTEHEAYCAAAVAPQAAPTATSVAWATNPGYTAMGFAPAGNVYYTYVVTVTAPAAGVAPAFLATATGDLDGDAAMAIYTIADTNDITQTTANNIY